MFRAWLRPALYVTSAVHVFLPDKETGTTPADQKELHGRASQFLRFNKPYTPLPEPPEDDTRRSALTMTGHTTFVFERKTALDKSRELENLTSRAGSFANIPLMLSRVERNVVIATGTLEQRIAAACFLSSKGPPISLTPHAQHEVAYPAIEMLGLEAKEHATRQLLLVYQSNGGLSWHSAVQFLETASALTQGLTLLGLSLKKNRILIQCEETNDGTPLTVKDSILGRTLVPTECQLTATVQRTTDILRGFTSYICDYTTAGPPFEHAPCPDIASCTMIHLRAFVSGYDRPSTNTTNHPTLATLPPSKENPTPPFAPTRPPPCAVAAGSRHRGTWLDPTANALKSRWQNAMSSAPSTWKTTNAAKALRSQALAPSQPPSRPSLPPPRPPPTTHPVGYRHSRHLPRGVS
jgi:hypothetical protein